MKAQVKYAAEVSVTLSEYEALVLITLLRHVGGPSSGPRGVADAMYQELNALELDESGFTGSTEGQVFFN